MISLYCLIAYYWGLPRKEAKLRVLEFCYKNPLNLAESDNHWDAPELLIFVPTEARFEILQRQGITLGDL